MAMADPPGWEHMEDLAGDENFITLGSMRASQETRASIDLPLAEGSRARPDATRMAAELTRLAEEWETGLAEDSLDGHDAPDAREERIADDGPQEDLSEPVVGPSPDREPAPGYPPPRGAARLLVRDAAVGSGAVPPRALTRDVAAGSGRVDWPRAGASASPGESSASSGAAPESLRAGIPGTGSGAHVEEPAPRPAPRPWSNLEAAESLLAQLRAVPGSIPEHPADSSREEAEADSWTDSRGADAGAASGSSGSSGAPSGEPAMSSSPSASASASAQSFPSDVAQTLASVGVELPGLRRAMRGPPEEARVVQELPRSFHAASQQVREDLSSARRQVLAVLHSQPAPIRTPGLSASTGKYPAVANPLHPTGGLPVPPAPPLRDHPRAPAFAAELDDIRQYLDQMKAKHVLPGRGGPHAEAGAGTAADAAAQLAAVLAGLERPGSGRALETAPAPRVPGDADSGAAPAEGGALTEKSAQQRAPLYGLPGPAATAPGRTSHYPPVHAAWDEARETIAGMGVASAALRVSAAAHSAAGASGSDAAAGGKGAVASSTPQAPGAAANDAAGVWAPDAGAGPTLQGSHPTPPSASPPPSARSTALAALPEHPSDASPGRALPGPEEEGAAPSLPAAAPPSTTPGAVPAEAESGRWGRLSRMLRDNGFAGVSAGGDAPGSEQLADALERVVAEYAKRSRLVSDLTKAAQMAAAREQQREAMLREAVESADRARKEARRARAAQDVGRDRQQTDTVEAARKAEAAERGTKKLRFKIDTLERALRQRDADMDRLKEHLAERVQREERRQQRDKEVYERLKRAHAALRADRTGSSRSPSGSAGAVAAATRELRPVEIVGIYEAQRDAMEQELETLRRENRSLAEQVADADGLLAKLRRRQRGARVTRGEGAGTAADESWGRSALDDSGLTAEDVEVVGRAHEADRRAGELAREVQEERARVQDLKRELARRVAEAEARAERLAEENASLILELESRPLLQELKSAKRQVDILAAQLQRARGGGAEPGAEAEAAAAAEAGRGRFGREAAAALGTREAVNRDRMVHKLGLSVVAKMHKDVLVELVQDLCIALEVGDPTVLPASLARLDRAARDVPPLTRFLDEVCDVALNVGERFLPPGFHRGNRNGVPEVLRAWVADLEELHERRAAMARMAECLATRPTAPPLMRSPGDVVRQVEDVVKCEKSLLGAQETLRAAESLLRADPEALLSRIVGHFMHLFDVKRLEGVLPGMNQVYVSWEEARNAIRSLGALLGMGPEASAQHVGMEVERLLRLAGEDPEALRARSAALHDDYKRARIPRAEGPARRGVRGEPAFVGVVLRDGDVIWEEKGADVVPMDRVPGLSAARRGQGAGGPMAWTEETPQSDTSSDAIPGPVAASALDEEGEAGVDDSPQGRGRRVRAPRAEDAHDEALKESVGALRELQGLFGANSVQGLLMHARRAAERLKRLDGLVPRYSKATTRLMEVLRVREIEEIVPAVERLVGALRSP